ncbi:MAG: M20/M25/M40 family metallo-hydrolase [Megasphaera sp.]|jgi:carboxypeptidase PM20D1|uniref:M20/M25/M40 family metallo-hydrolase n=1 Tax=Megasphaera sueciensis TaxID=349094 RepID=UPI003D0190A9|nr:M20/M25/M40 family metallo-hydrolase [Megasphaera sp.]
MKVTKDKKMTAHFQKIIQCATISNEYGNKVDWREFGKLHQWLQKFYPTIYREFRLTEIGEAGLQFCFKADNPVKEPLMLMAHQDVVEVGDLAQWTYDPFSGELVDDCVYGRGTTDCKHLLAAEMEAVEDVFASGWRPPYDLYISLGFGEEIYRADGPDGARLLCQNLQTEGVTIGCTFDEGGSIVRGKDNKLVARIGLGEKACVNIEIYKDSAGGHASKPGLGTALGAVAKAIVDIEAHPYPYRLIPLAEAQLKAAAAVEDGDKKRIYQEPKKYWEELCALARQDPELDAMLHTTFAFTMAQASNQPNVLPSHVGMTMSCRILQGDTIESVMQYLQQFLPEGVRLRHVSGEDPMPTSTPDSDDYRTVERVLHTLYGKNIILVPFLMLGATDTHYYTPVVRRVFRFDGFLVDHRWGGAHQVNERIPVDALPGSKQFFKTFLLEY